MSWKDEKCEQGLQGIGPLYHDGKKIICVHVDEHNFGWKSLDEASKEEIVSYYFNQMKHYYLSELKQVNKLIISLMESLESDIFLQHIKESLKDK